MSGGEDDGDESDYDYHGDDDGVMVTTMMVMTRGRWSVIILALKESRW